MIHSKCLTFVTFSLTFVSIVFQNRFNRLKPIAQQATPLNFVSGIYKIVTVFRLQKMNGCSLYLRVPLAPALFIFLSRFDKFFVSDRFR